MYIRELAARTGFTPDTIRFYEKLHLLNGNRRSRQSHRQYDESHVATLLQVKFAKAMGFTLKDMRDKLINWGSLTAAEKQTILTEQLRKVEQATTELEQVRDYLRTKIAHYNTFDCSPNGVISTTPSAAKTRE